MFITFVSQKTAAAEELPSNYHVKLFNREFRNLEQLIEDSKNFFATSLRTPDVTRAKPETETQTLMRHRKAEAVKIDVKVATIVISFQRILPLSSSALEYSGCCGFAFSPRLQTAESVVFFF